MIFRRNNYEVNRSIGPGGPLASALRIYGSIGGANARVEQLARAKLAQGGPSIFARIYAPTTLDIAPEPFNANSAPSMPGIAGILYEQAKGGNK